MSEISLKEMLEAGVHFGHKSERWNPKMRPFIFTERNGVHIFDLAQTKEKLSDAVNFVSRIAGEDGVVLFVGTKNQTKEVVRNAALEAGMPYLVERWPGGMLTNFHTILGRLKYMKEAEEKTASGNGLTKKESLFLARELDKLKIVFEGVRDLKKLPDVVFVASVHEEKNAVRESQKLGIPIVGITDSNATPDVDYVIPGNDDAVRSVAYISGKISEGIAIHKKMKEIREAEEAAKESKEAEESADKVPTPEEKEIKQEEKAAVKKSKPKAEAKEDSK